MAGMTLCHPLTQVDSLYPQARDTVVESEGQAWPAKRVALAPGQWILFEASGPDTTQVSRITSNSPTFHTASGLHAGTTIDEVRATRDSFEVDFGEGSVAIRLVPEGIWFSLDDSASALVWQAFTDKADERAALRGRARLTDVTIAADCSP